MTQKALSLLLLLVMLAGLLAGCAGGGTPATTTTAGTTASAATTAKTTTTAAATTTTAAASTAATADPNDPLAPVPSPDKENFNINGYPIVNDSITVTSLFYLGEYVGKPETMAYWQAMEKISNIHIDWTMLPGADMDTELNLFFAAGEFPDFFHWGLNQERIQSFGVEGGQFYDISKKMDELMPNMVGWFTEFPEAKNVITQINGAIYTLPCIERSSTAAVGQMFYRTDYLEDVGLDVPKTVEEFTAALQAIKDAGLTQGYAPLLPYNIDSYIYHTETFLFGAFGDSVNVSYSDNGDGKVVFNQTSEQYKRYLEYANMLYAQGLLDNEMFTLDSAVTMSRVKEGKAAFMSYAANIMEEDFPDGQIHLDCLAPLTSEYTDTQKIKAYDYIRTSGGTITTKSKYPEELMRMLDIDFSRSEVMPGTGLDSMSQSLGIFGITWDWRDEAKSGYKLLTPSDWTVSPWLYKLKYGAWYQFYGVVDYLGTSSDKGNNYAREKGMIENNMPYAVVPFPDTYLKYSEDEYQNILNTMTDINNYVTQMRAKFISGVEPLSNWDAYVAEINKMGIDKVLAVKQIAYDRWNGK